MAVDATGPAFGEMAVDAEDVMALVISRLSGSQVVVETSVSVTVDEFKERLQKEGIVGDVFSFNLMKEDGTVLKPGTASLSDFDLLEQTSLMVITGRSRDYGKITKFDHVIAGIQYPQGSLTNDRGELFVCSFYGELKVFDADFNMIRETHLPRTPPTQMAFALTGELLISFTGHPIGVFDPVELKLLRWLGEGRSSNGIAVSGEVVFVSDSTRNQVCVHRIVDDKLIARWGDFNHPCGLAVLDDRLLAVADRRNHRVQLIDFSGMETGSEKRLADIGVGELKNPNDVAVDPDGNLLVLDTQNERIAVFDKDGSLLSSVMPGFFRARSNTYSYLSVNQLTGTICVSFDDEHKVVILAPLFPAAPGDPSDTVE